jgi:hypothetical protein
VVVAPSNNNFQPAAVSSGVNVFKSAPKAEAVAQIMIEASKRFIVSVQIITLHFLIQVFPAWLRKTALTPAPYSDTPLGLENVGHLL